MTDNGKPQLSEMQRLAPACWNCALPDRAKWFCETGHPMIMWADPITCPMCAKYAPVAPDSLVARLRDQARSRALRAYESKTEDYTEWEAADRIEQQDKRIGELEDDVARRSKQYNELAERNDAAEARLARIEQAADAMSAILCDCEERAAYRALRYAPKD